MEVSELVEFEDEAALVVLVALSNEEVVVVEDFESVENFLWSLVALAVLDDPALEHVGHVLRDSQIGGTLGLVELGVAHKGQNQAQRDNCSLIHFLL